MIEEHAPLAPSSAPQWGYCSGSVVANINAPDIDTQDQRDGTAAHWVLAECLLVWRDGTEGRCANCFDWVGQVAPNGVVIDEAMAEGAQTCVDDVLLVAQKHGALRRLMVEHRVRMPAIHDQNWGTFDVGLYVPGSFLYIWDYKHGRRENRAKGNLQLINYVEGIKQAYLINGQQDQQITASLRMVQPNCWKPCGAVDEWCVPLSDLRGYITQLRAKAHEVFLGPTMSPGMHCRNCAAVKTCSSARRAVHSWADYANSPYEIDKMSGHDLAVERQLIKEGMAVAKSRLAAIEDDLTYRLRAGEAGTSLALHTKPGRRKWLVPVEQAVAFASQFGVDIAKSDALTPTQTVAKMPHANRAMFDTALDNITERPTGSLQLIDADDSVSARAFKRK